MSDNAGQYVKITAADFTANDTALFCSTADTPTVEELLRVMEKFRNAGHLVVEHNTLQDLKMPVIHSNYLPPGIMYRMRLDYGLKPMLPYMACDSAEREPSFLYEFERWWAWKLREIENRKKTD